VLGTNELRVGQIAEGQSALARAFKLDPFNLWHKNTLDLLDKMKSFTTIERGRFQLVAPPEEAELLALYALPLLESAYDALAVRYGYKPPTPVRLEFYRQHADFSVRTVGLAGLGALGVSFGSLLAMDTPSARERGDFNWGSTAWHELTHAFTLGASDHRVPRWLSEGMSVLEERRAGHGWGADASLSYIAALGGGRLRPMSQLNDGFLRPRFPEETQFSYYQASLFCEMVEAQKGAAALPAMLVAYRNGLDTPGVFKRVLGLTPDQVDAAFDLWMRDRFAKPLLAVTARDSSGESGAFVTAMREGVALLERSQRDSARVMFERARVMIPDYSGADGPAWYLARLERDAGNTAAALANVSQVTMRNETAWDANLLEAELREKSGDDAGALAALERLMWIHPYDPALHARMATLAAKRNDHVRAVRERRAVLASSPPDALDARYELARALAAAGDIAGARKELLQTLEQAPSFEKAQALLLELRGRTR
jgi:tetratricopeptide (TPR) repeat protein